MTTYGTTIQINGVNWPVISAAFKTAHKEQAKPQETLMRVKIEQVANGWIVYNDPNYEGMACSARHVFNDFKEMCAHLKKLSEEKKAEK